MSRTALAILMILVGGFLSLFFRFEFGPIGWVGALMVAGGVFVMSESGTGAKRARRKRELWARMHETEGEDRVRVLQELADQVDVGDAARLRKLSVDPDPLVRPLATRLLNQTASPPRRAASTGSALVVWKVAGCLLLAVGAWRLGKWVALAFVAPIIGAQIAGSAWAGVGAILWLTLTSFLLTLAMAFGPESRGWIEALLGGAIVLGVALVEARDTARRWRRPRR
jgi:hypothetical protein